MNLIKEISEMALIKALPDMLDKELKPGRLKNRMNKLAELADRRIPARISLSDKDILADKIEQFGTATGWAGHQKNLYLYISFLLCLTEDKTEFSGILNDICNFLTKCPPACEPAAVLALKKWEGLWE